MTLFYIILIVIVAIYTSLCISLAGKRMSVDEWDKWLDEQERKRKKRGK